VKKNVYSGIFDIVNQELQNFRFSKESYMFLTELSPFEADVLELMKCPDNRTFLECAYMAFLQRPIDTKAFDNWKDRFSMNEEEFRRAVINTLVSSQEFINAEVSVENNVFSTNTVSSPSAVSGSSAVRWPDRLLRIYRKQPEFVKKVVRKSMGIK
jgi:hypothetical protein